MSEDVIDHVPDETVEQVDIQGVLVRKIKNDEGEISVEVQPVNVEATEVQTLIELGVKSWRQAIGL